MYDNKLNILDEMEKFLERHKLPKLIKRKIESLNTLITRNWIIKKFPQRKSQKREPQSLILPNVKGKFNTKLSQTLSKNRKGTCSNSFYEVTISLNPKSDITRKGNYRPIYFLTAGIKIFHKY